MEHKSNDEYLIAGGRKVNHKTVVIKAGSAKAVSLGVYEKTVGDPTFDVSFVPDLHEDIGVSHEKLAIPGQDRYMLLYQFQNFSEQSCSVTLQYHPGIAGR